MKLSAIVGSTKRKAGKLLDDFNKALPVISSLGLSVTKIGIEMGLFPVTRAVLRGSIDSLDKGKIQQLITTHKKNKIAVAILKSLETAANVKNVVQDMPFKGVQVEVALGVGFKVKVDFIRASQTVHERARLHQDPVMGGHDEDELAEAV